MAPGLTGIGVHPEGLSVLRIERNGGRPVLTVFDFRKWDGGTDRAKTLARTVADYDLKRARCTTALDPNEYALLLTEAPDVPAEELRAALRWRIKDLIDFHVNDATLDVFEVPGEKASGRARSMYAVAARSSAIQKRVDLLDAAGASLEVIDIPEMAQRNVAALLPEDAKGVACLTFQEASALLTITKQSEVYLTRTFDVGLEALSQQLDLAPYFERIVLEIQRSLDYFESHFRQAPVGSLAIGPVPEPIPGLLEHLQANLNVIVTSIDFSRLVDCRQDIPLALQSRCFATLGAALRQEAVAL